MKEKDQLKSTIIKDLPVTVAMATYNGAQYLEEQLDSILAQTLKPAEIIVCDDASEDTTAEILQRYQSKGLLRYSINDKRLGYLGNFKRAVSLASSGHYVSLSDQDDIWFPGKIEAAMKVMLELEDRIRPAMVYSDLILVDEDKQLLNPSFRNELGQDRYKHTLDTLLFGGFVNGCTMLMDPLMANYFSTIPDREFITHDTWIALIGYTFGQVGMVPDALIHYRRHGNNTTDLLGLKKRTRFERIKSEMTAALQKNDLFEKELVCVESFFKTFADKLDRDQQQLILKFLRLKGKSYVTKKVALRRFFNRKWL